MCPNNAESQNIVIIWSYGEQLAINVVVCSLQINNVRPEKSGIFVIVKRACSYTSSVVSNLHVGHGIEPF